MTRPVVQLHHIHQWLQQPPEVQSILLQNLKLKDRLLKWRREQETKKLKPLDAAKWVPCSKCDALGHVLIEPRYPGIHPSQLPHPCMLKIYWEMEGKPGQERHETRALLTFDLGHAVHHMFQSYGQQGAWGPVYRPEAKILGKYQQVAKELWLVGSADADNIIVIDDIPNAPIYEVGVVHEYKTIKKENFDKLTRPKPEHLKQATIYAGVLDRPVVAYLYFNKNDSTMSDYPVPFNSGTWEELRAKAALLVRHYEEEEPPAASVGFHCTQCPYAYDCEAQKAAQRNGAAARR